MANFRQIIFIFTLLLSIPGEGCSQHLTNNVISYYDRPLLMREADLTALQNAYLNKDAAVAVKVADLVTNADKAVGNKLYSVTFFNKASLRPGIDVHDYWSQSGYYWQDETKPGKLSYVKKDGVQNPDAKKYRDAQQMQQMVEDVRVLSLAYFFTKNEKYAQKAKKVMQTWFLDKATMMNPNLNHAEFVPNKNNGTASGIIQSRNLCYIPDAIYLMKNSSGIDSAFKNGIARWFNQYLHWLLNNDLGIQEGKALNNHGTYYTLQAAVFAAATGNLALAKSIINQNGTNNIKAQISTDGTMPSEMKRTKSFSYFIFNLKAFSKLAVLSENIGGTDLWNYATRDGKSIHTSFKWIAPYIAGKKQWNAQQIKSVKIDADNVKALLFLASEKYPDVQFIPPPFKGYEILADIDDNGDE